MLQRDPLFPVDSYNFEVILISGRVAERLKPLAHFHTCNVGTLSGTVNSVRQATSMILALSGLALIWLPAVAGGGAFRSSGALLSNVLASLGLLLLLGLLHGLKRRK